MIPTARYRYVVPWTDGISPCERGVGGGSDPQRLVEKARRTRARAARRSPAQSAGRRGAGARGSRMRARPVISPAVNSGTPNRRLRPSAAPRNSAMSVAIAITSAWIHNPHRRLAGEPLPGELREAAASRDPELRRQVLDEHRHRVGKHHDPQQRVAEPRAALDVRGEVPGVDVGDRGHERRAEHREQRPQPAALEQALDRTRAPRGRPRWDADAPRAGRPRRRPRWPRPEPGERWRAHRSTSTRIARVRLPPSTCTSSPNCTNSGPSNGCLSTTSNVAPARSRARRGTGACPDRSRRSA